jgi:hypothetical protein
MSTWRGVLPRSRKSWISVSTVVGMRFIMATLRGRMSCCSALASVITNTFSFRRALYAGRVMGIRIGMGVSYKIIKKKYRPAHGKNSWRFLSSCNNSGGLHAKKQRREEP